MLTATTTKLRFPNIRSIVNASCHFFIINPLKSNGKKKVATPAEREVVIGAGAKALAAASNTLSEMLNNLTHTVEDLDLKIDAKTAKLNDLNVEYTEKERKLQLDMSMSLQEKGLAAATEVLGKHKKVSIDAEELNKLRDDYANIKNSYKDDLTKATSALVAEERAKWAQEKLLLTAQNEKAAAEDKFALKGATERNALLEKQIEMLTKQLNDERAAGIERAKASAVGAVNIGQPQR